MAIFPVSSLLGEKVIEPPLPKLRTLKLPPKPPAPRNESSETRVVSRTPQPQPQQRAAAGTTRAVVRQQAERDTRQVNTERTQEFPGQAILLSSDGQGGQGDGSGGERERGRDGDGELAGAGSRGVIDPVQDDIDCDMLAGLLPTGGDDGIFEVLLPCGGKLGVAVDIGQRSTSFLLMPSTERLRTQIKKKKMELENTLARRMETQVRLTVL